MVASSSCFQHQPLLSVVLLKIADGYIDPVGLKITSSWKAGGEMVELIFFFDCSVCFHIARCQKV